MKCIDKFKGVVSIILCTTLLLSGCGSKEYSYAYKQSVFASDSSVRSKISGQKLIPFASDLCIANDDVTEGTTVDMTSATAAGLFDVNSNNVIYAKNIHNKMNPASLTKVLTAICALQYGNLNDVLTASANVKITEKGAVKLGLETGDTMTLDQALHVLLLKSANDVAVMIAEYLAGSVEDFSVMMNDMANSLGATNSHFVNPHGLSDPNHYTTVYDLYLICNKAVTYDKFIEIIHTSSYKSVYHDKSGKEKNIDLNTTNGYLKGEFNAPQNITVIGGKTGTTNAAGSCLVLYSRDQAGNPYISVILQSTDRTTMFNEMTSLLKEI